MIANKPIHFSASRASELLATGTGKTRSNYIYELAEQRIGIIRDFRTKQMIHGIDSEHDAISILISIHGGYRNTDNNGNQVYFLYNEYIGATPDMIGDDFVGDAKCQYSINGYMEQCDKLLKKYYIQIQCQMMALDVDKGYLINYLTKPEEWGDDEWKEYPFPLEDRYFIHVIKRDDVVIHDLKVAAEKYYPYIEKCAEIMTNAEILDDVEFFKMQRYNSIRFNKIKDLNWIENEFEKVFRYKDDFFKIK